MKKTPGGYGNDLAADLIADLSRPLPLDRRPLGRLPQSPNALSAVDSLRSAPVHTTRSRGPALEGSLRLSPLDWRKPSLRVGAQSATILLGPIHAELGIRVG
jgi:hypothetical protein